LKLLFCRRHSRGLSDPVGGPCFIPGARKRGSLFEQPSDVLPYPHNAFFKFVDRRFAAAIDLMLNSTTAATAAIDLAAEDRALLKNGSLIP
jgi:hypothetical protein